MRTRTQSTPTAHQTTHPTTHPAIHPATRSPRRTRRASAAQRAAGLRHRLPAHALPMTATVAATSLVAALGTSLLPTGSAAAERSDQDVTVSALSELPPRVVAAPSATSRVTAERASRGAARTAPRATRLVWRTVAVGPTFRGEASWYGPGFQGRTTANGERYDMYAMTAAHKTLPFGTRLRVCRGERCVVVRINDRGPYAGGRVLDLSKAAAQRLGYSGTAWVSATPVRQKQVRVAA